VFSNYASLDTYLPTVEEACRALGIPLDCVGRGVGRASNKPEELLSEYDLVFAVSKAAMEAMAVGAAVVLCDFGLLGPMVSPDNFDRLRSFNFGIAGLAQPLTPEGVTTQVETYDPAEAGRVRDLVRSRCGLEQAVAELVRTYEQVIEEAADLGASVDSSSAQPTGRRLATLRYRASKAPFVAFYKVFGLGPRRVPRPLRPAYVVIRAVMRRLLWVGSSRPTEG
jgi:hypothetical protein